jgi:hypothetical protein
MDANVIKIYDWNPTKVKSFQDEFEVITNSIDEIKSIDLFCSKPEIDEAYLIIHICGGNLLNDYFIKMRIPRDYPYSLPYCFELSNNFPKTGKTAIDRHITQEVSYMQTDIKGSFCMISPFRIKPFFGNFPMDIYNTLNLLLIPHLENQEYYTKHGRFMGDGENVYKHGATGLIQSFSDVFGIEKKEDILSILQLAKKNKLTNNDICFCGSGKIIKKCHLDVVFRFRNLFVWNEHIDPLIYGLAFSIFRDPDLNRHSHSLLTNYSIDNNKRTLISKILHANDVDI